MDIFTQGILGAATAQWGAKKDKIRKASVIGAFAGFLPDSDVLINSKIDPLFGLEMHRHFSHSLFFVPFGGLIAALLVYYFYRKTLGFKEVYWFAVLGYSTHGLLDSFTTYGTMLFWPFSFERISYELVSIIDPIYTIPLLLFVIFAAIFKSRKIAISGLIFCMVFFSFNYLQNKRVEDEMQKIVAEKNHKVEARVLLPTIGNNILWKATYKANDAYYTNAIRVNWLGEVKRYGGDEIKAIDANIIFPELGESTVQRKDILRFEKFANGFIAGDKNNPNKIVDVRYSANPATTHSLWGITIDKNNPNEHVRFSRDGAKRMEKSNLEVFKKMLLGLDL